MPLKSTAWDFLVAGAGPAGSRAAELLAARGASVVLLDPRVPYDEPCSIGLTAGALEHTPELRELKDYSEIVTEVLVVVPSRASVVVPLRAQCWVVSRLTLSRWGLERAQAAGARLVPAAVRSADREHGVWRVKDSRGVVHRARRILAADGATSWLRGWLASKLKPQLDSACVAATLVAEVALPEFRHRRQVGAEGASVASLDALAHVDAGCRERTWLVEAGVEPCAIHRGTGWDHRSRRL